MSLIEWLDKVSNANGIAGISNTEEGERIADAEMIEKMVLENDHDMFVHSFFKSCRIYRATDFDLESSKIEKQTVFESESVVLSVAKTDFDWFCAHVLGDG